MDDPTTMIFGYYLPYDQACAVIKAVNPDLYQSKCDKSGTLDFEVFCDFFHHVLEPIDGIDIAAQIDEESGVIIGVLMALDYKDGERSLRESFTPQDLFSRVSIVDKIKIPGFTPTCPPRVFIYRQW